MTCIAVHVLKWTTFVVTRQYIQHYAQNDKAIIGIIYAIYNYYLKKRAPIIHTL